MPEFVAACRAAEVAEGRGRTVEVEGLRIAVVRDGEAWHALSARCPHAGGDLGSGWVEDGELVCPLHRWRFRLRDGRCTTDRGQSVHRFGCNVREGTVFVEV